MIKSYRVTKLIVANEFGIKDCKNCTENIRCAECQRRVDEAMKRTVARMKAHAEAMATRLLFGDITTVGEPLKMIPINVLPDRSV